MTLVRPRSPLARALVPVAGGTLVLAAILGATWAVAAWISRGGADSTERLAPSTFYVGRVDSVSDEIDESGPLLFPGLDNSTGERTVVLAHEGDDPTEGWIVSWAYPADRDPACHVEQVEHTDRFTDCSGREISVDDLAREAALCPIVENRETISIGLRLAVCGQSPD